MYLCNGGTAIYWQNPEHLTNLFYKKIQQIPLPPSLPYVKELFIFLYLQTVPYPECGRGYGYNYFREK